MSTVAFTTDRGLASSEFFLLRNFPQSSAIRGFKDKIVVEGRDGYSIEFYGETLAPKKGTGIIDSGALLIDGVKVAEISDVGFDIASKKWTVAVVTGGFFPLDVVLGTSLSDTFPGDEFTVLGARGNDTISARGTEKNFLFGGAGDDHFNVAPSAIETYFDGGKGYDIVDYGSLVSKQDVVASLADDAANSGGALGHTYNKIDDLRGGRGDDLLTGDGKANKLSGNAGSDTILGGAGRDTLDGGDLPNGRPDDEGFDFVSYADTPETGGIGAYVSLKDGVANAHGVAGEVIRNFEGVIGSSFRDRLIGDDGDNVLRGEDGSDTLQGGKGADTLRGDEEAFGFDDADQFVYGAANEGGDKILDYDIYDQIGISRSGFGLEADFSIVDGTSFMKGKNVEAVTDGPTFLFNTKTGKLLFDEDGSGSGKGKVLAEVTYANPDSLDAGDFVLLF